MAHLCSLLTILPVAPCRIPKPCVAGSNPAGGAVCWGSCVLGVLSSCLGIVCVPGSSRSMALTPAKRTCLPEHSHELRAANVGWIWLGHRFSIDSGLQAPAAPG